MKAEEAVEMSVCLYAKSCKFDCAPAFLVLFSTLKRMANNVSVNYKVFYIKSVIIVFFFYIHFGFKLVKYSCPL